MHAVIYSVSVLSTISKKNHQKHHYSLKKITPLKSLKEKASREKKRISAAWCKTIANHTANLKEVEAIILLFT